MTRDIDLVIDPTHGAMRVFANGLDRSRHYLPDWRSEFDRRGMVNVIEPATGWKVDLIFRKDRPFSAAEFERRQQVTILGVDVYVATVEDTILAKLEWAKQSGSDRQVDDVRGMLGTQDVDQRYLATWAEQLGVAEVLSAVSQDRSE